MEKTTLDKIQPQQLPDIKDHADALLWIAVVRDEVKWLKPGRELSLAITKLDEAYLWLHEAMRVS